MTINPYWDIQNSVAAWGIIYVPESQIREAIIKWKQRGVRVEELPPELEELYKNGPAPKINLLREYFYDIQPYPTWR